MQYYSYFTVKYPRERFTLEEIMRAYFSTRRNHTLLLESNTLFFFENILPLVRVEDDHLLFLFPLAAYREETEERELLRFYSLWVSRLEERLSTLPYVRFVKDYGVEPSYVRTLEEVPSSIP